tara:strand:+ start:53449 stop:54225 length:777 start_codon:yes stop_codon:yes gene_type:complete
MAIGKKYNFDDVFFRDLTICTLAMLEERLGWVNRFESGDVDVSIPIFYSLSGKNDDYLLDSFVDDIVGDDRQLELNTDVIPRAHITLKNWRMKGDEFANPNVFLRQVVEDSEEIRKVLTKLRAIPITANFSATILLNSELDTFKASESIMNALMFYDHMYFEFNFMYIDAVATFPDENNIEIVRDYSMDGTDGYVKMEFNFEVQTYYPAFGERQIWGRPKKVKWINQLKQGKTDSINTQINRDEQLKKEQTFNPKNNI